MTERPARPADRTGAPSRPDQRAQAGRGGPGVQPPPPPTTRIRAEEVAAIFAPDGYLAVNRLGRDVGNALIRAGAGTSQVRNILDSFQAILETWDANTEHAAANGRQIARLQPNLIYLAARETGRDKKIALEGLAATLGHAIDQTLAADSPDQMRQRFTVVVDLVEALTAYHRVGARS